MVFDVFQDLTFGLTQRSFKQLVFICFALYLVLDDLPIDLSMGCLLVLEFSFD